jgi:SAM-dependent methyltransferase
VPPPLIEATEHPCCLCGSERRTVIGTGPDFEYDTCANLWTYVRCDGCGHHYLNPRPEPGALATIYPPSYGNYSNSIDPGLAFRVKAWLEGFDLRRLGAAIPPGGAVLDIGCGDGRLLDGIRRACPHVGRLEGIEIAKAAAAGAVASGYPVTIGSIDDLELEPSRYDLVCLIQVIEHLFEPVACVRKVRRALRPGGRVLFETPSVRCADFALFRRRYWGGYHFPRHLNLFEPASFARMLEAAGLEVLSVTHKLQPVHWVWSCHHFLKAHRFPRRIAEGFNIRNPFYLGIFSCIDAVQLLLLRRSSNMQVIARRP